MTKHLQSRDGKGRIRHGPPGGSSSSSGYYLLGPGASGLHASPHILAFPHNDVRRAGSCLAGPRPVPPALWVAAEGSGRPSVAWLSATSPRLGLAKAFLADHHVLLRPSTRPGLSLDQGRTIQIPDWCASRRPRPPLRHHNHTAPISADSLSSGLCHTAPNGLRRMDSLLSLRPVEASHDGGTLLPAMLPCTLQQA